MVLTLLLSLFGALAGCDGHVRPGDAGPVDATADTGAPLCALESIDGFIVSCASTEWAPTDCGEGGPASLTVHVGERRARSIEVSMPGLESTGDCTRIREDFGPDGERLCVAIVEWSCAMADGSALTTDFVYRYVDTWSTAGIRVRLTGPDGSECQALLTDCTLMF